MRKFSMLASTVTLSQLLAASAQVTTLSLCPDPAVGAEPGETEPGPVPAALLPVQPAGQRAPEPQEPPRRGQPVLQEHAGTSGGLFRVFLPRSGKKHSAVCSLRPGLASLVTGPPWSPPVRPQVCSRDEVTLKSRTLAGGGHRRRRRGLPSSLKPLEGLNGRSRGARHSNSQVVPLTANVS